MCKAPFHERLYELFGLQRYMPPSWEFNATNAPEHPDKWGADLLWCWKSQIHALQKPELSEIFGWQSDAAEVVKVCEHLIPLKDNSSLGKRNFFYQCFNGHWNEEENEFRFGPHPRGWLWNMDGLRVTDDDGVRNFEEGAYEEPSAREELHISESEWREIFRNDAIDFLMDEHSPRTRQALQEMQQSQFMRDLLEEEGPARRTRSRVRRLYSGEENVVVGTHDNEAGTSNTPMNID